MRSSDSLDSFGLSSGLPSPLAYLLTDPVRCAALDPIHASPRRLFVGSSTPRSYRRVEGLPGYWAALVHAPKSNIPLGPPVSARLDPGRVAFGLESALGTQDNRYFGTAFLRLIHSPAYASPRPLPCASQG